MSKAIDDPKIQTLVFFVAILVLSLVLWPLIDFLSCLIFTHSNFAYSVKDHILEPILFSALMTLIFFVVPNFRKARAAKKSKANKKS
ncbi:hypothetical protein IK110_01640 [Candidatus Saccharibacteria bacterium]|nr:hypothetical protein [Candidatus Saccharibacteria bacterium]